MAVAQDRKVSRSLRPSLSTVSRVGFPKTHWTEAQKNNLQSALSGIMHQLTKARACE